LLDRDDDIDIGTGPGIENTRSDKIDIRHHIVMGLVGGLYPGKEDVERALTPTPSKPKVAILDVGCGSGLWAIEMAKKFPHVDVKGIDLLLPPPVTGVTDLPPNVVWEIDDANLPMTLYNECFDVVHARSVASGINDYREFIAKVAAMLRPGGVGLFIENDWWLYDENRVPVTFAELDDSTASWNQRIMGPLRRILASRGQNPQALAHRVAWLQAREEFDHVQEIAKFIPVGPWDQNASKEESYLAHLEQQFVIQRLEELRPVLLSGHDVSEETIHEFCSMGKEEFISMKPRFYARWSAVWARKRAAPA